MSLCVFQNKMNSGELKVDVPLAAIESDCEDEDSNGQRQRRHRSGSARRSPTSSSRSTSTRTRTSSVAPKGDGGGGGPSSLDPASVTGSLEDLVNSFDDKLTQCFKDYQEQVEKIAPVQVRLHRVHRFKLIQNVLQS